MGSISLPLGNQVPVPISQGGTGSTTALSNNRVIVSSSDAYAEAAAITASRALISDANGIPVHATTTSTEIGYVNGVTSALQTQLNAKAALAGATFTGDVYVSGTTISLRLPNVTTTQRDAISSPAAGMLVYNTTTAAFNGYTSSWGAISGGGGGGSSGSVLVSQSTTVGNSGSSETDLFTTTIAGGTLSANGSTIAFEAAGSWASNLNSKTINIKFGSTTINTITGFTGITIGAAFWSVRGYIMRSGATAQKIYSFIEGSLTTIPNAVTTTETLSGSVIFKITGTGTSTDDISIETAKVWLWPAS